MEKNFNERMYKAKIVFVVAVLVAVLGYSLFFWPQEYRQRRWFWLPFGN